MTGAPARMLKLYWRRFLNRRTVTLDGVTVSTEKATTPRFVRSLLFKETYEAHERELVKKLLGPGDRVLEIGTGIGFVSILCARLCGEGNVRSHEANPTLEAIIRKNYDLNGLTPNLHMRAITLDGRPICFFRNDNIISSSTVERESFTERLTVEADAIDDAIDQHKPTVLIMDVEGGEIELLSRSELRGIRHVIVEVHPHITGEASVEEMTAAVVAHGFSIQDQSHKTIHFSRTA